MLYNVRWWKVAAAIDSEWTFVFRMPGGSTKMEMFNWWVNLKHWYFQFLTIDIACNMVNLYVDLLKPYKDHWHIVFHRTLFLCNTQYLCSMQIISFLLLLPCLFKVLPESIHSTWYFISQLLWILLGYNTIRQTTWHCFSTLWVVFTFNWYNIYLRIDFFTFVWQLISLRLFWEMEKGEQINL